MTTIPFPVCLAVATAIAFIMEQSNLLFATFYYGILIFVAYFLVEPEPREIDFDAIDSYVNRPTDESLQSLEREEKHIEKPTEAIAIPKIEAIVSDHKKRALRIEEELTQIIKETQEEELGEEMEQEAIAALLKGVSWRIFPCLLTSYPALHLVSSTILGIANDTLEKIL